MFLNLITVSYKTLPVISIVNKAYSKLHKASLTKI